MFIKNSSFLSVLKNLHLVLVIGLQLVKRLAFLSASMYSFKSDFDVIICLLSKQSNYTYCLTLAVHLFVVGLIVTRGYIVEPLLVLEIPLHGLFYSFLELERGFPAKSCLKLARVDGVTGIMAKAVGNVGDEVEVFTFFATEEPVNCIYHYLDDVDVLPLIEAANVVGFGYFALMEDEVDGTGMVFYKEPVAHVFAFAIDWQWFAVADVVDEERNQFFWELVWAIVVRAVGHDGRHAVCIVESTNEVV